MQVNVEDVSSLTRRLTVVLPQEMVAGKLAAAYQELGSEVSIKGFRKGKVPRKVLEKSYGRRIEQEVAEKLIQETYFDALEESKLDAVVHPEIRDQKFTEDGSFSYEADVDVRPQFELGDYKGIEVEQALIEVSDAEVEAELEAMRLQMAPLRSVEGRGIALGDIAVVDFQGFHDGAPMKQVVGENYSVDVGSGRNGKEFEEKLIGLKKGEETSQEIDFPHGFANPVLAGKTVRFRINVKDVKERVLADLDDEFARDVGEEFNTLDVLKEHIRSRKRREKEELASGDLDDKIMLKLLEAHDFEVPRRLVVYEIDALVKEMEANLERQGLTLESAGLNRKSLAAQYEEAAEKRVRGDFILKKIAEQEEIKLENSDIDRGFQRIAEKYNMPVSEVRTYFSNRNDLLPFMNELLSEKTLKFLRSAAVIKEVALQAESGVSSEETSAAGEQS